ncbi:MAG: DUF4294 domain-containing protein [Flavobacteriaceae bacterium]|nr:DUF4294 domain-containing protein [Flavobacteriaceae bacterium]
MVFSQEQTDDLINKEYIKIIGDTIVKGPIELGEVILLPKRPYKNSDQIRKYLILKRKTLKVYPYAVMASDRLNSLNLELSEIKRKRKKKRYTKKVQKFLEKEFTEELSKLTQTEGQILIKLIHRQTGRNTYKLVKSLRNGIKAFLYNTTAKFFNMNLKEEFTPNSDLSDYYIEDIIQRSVRDNIIQYSEPTFKYDLFELKNIWNSKTIDK